MARFRWDQGNPHFVLPCPECGNEHLRFSDRPWASDTHVHVDFQCQDCRRSASITIAERRNPQGATTVRLVI
jgi:hypothetical protein